ncbi:MAG: hypothetical protein AB7P00_33295 [Sandaracinaceae bacterium]
MSNAATESFRMQVVSRARAFKRSWVDMAEALVEVRNRVLHRSWGYETLHGYAQEELNIKRSTCEKLTGSYHAIERHAPHVLGWDGVAQPMPEMDTVDFFARSVEPKPRRDGEIPDKPAPEVVADLRRALFEDNATIPTLRKRLNEGKPPKDDDEARRALIERVRASARKLEELVVHVDGLSEERVEQVTSCMEELRSDLDELAR